MKAVEINPVQRVAIRGSCDFIKFEVFFSQTFIELPLRKGSVRNLVISQTMQSPFRILYSESWAAWRGLVVFCSQSPIGARRLGKEDLISARKYQSGKV